MRCLLLVVLFFFCSSACSHAAPWIADISEVSEVVALEEGPDSVTVWLPSGERATVGVYGTESIRVTSPPEVGVERFVQYLWHREVFRNTDEKHVAAIPYWLPSRRWRPPGQETGGPYALQLHARAEGDFQVAIACDDDKVLTIDLHVTPSIPDPDMGFGFYFCPPHHKYPKDFRKYFEHMRDLRNNTFTIYQSHPAELETGPERIAWQLDLALDTGLIDGKVPIFVMHCNPPDIDGAYQYGRRVEEWPELLGYGKDEPGNTEQHEAEARGMVSMFNGAGYRSGSAISDTSLYRFGDGLDIWICLMSDFNDMLKREALRQEKELWAYSCTTRGTNAPLNRYFSGWWCFKNRPRVLMTWTYMDDMLAMGVPEPSSVQEDGKWTPCGYFEFSLGAPDGPISSVGLEARRDGIVDYMVLRELERAILAARVNQDEDPVFHALIKEASQWLQNQVDLVDVNFWPNDVNPEGDCVLPNPCHWDARDLVAPPEGLRDFNGLRRQAMEYTEFLKQGPITPAESG